MKSIANIENIFGEYMGELDSRIMYVNSRIFDEQKKYNKYISVFIKGALLIGDLLNRDGFGIVDGEFCGIDEIDDDTGVFFIKNDNKWIFEDNWKEIFEDKLSIMIEKAIEAGKGAEERIRQEEIKKAISFIEKNGYFVSKG